MALNVTFTGYVYDETSAPRDGVYYQFAHLNNTSNAITWKGFAKQTLLNGYYNANLGDGDWLTQDGHIQVGDKVLLAFWVGGEERSSNHIDEFCSIEFTIENPSKFLYIQNIQIRDNTGPICDFDISGSLILNDVITLTDRSIDESIWEAYDIAHRQRRLWNNSIAFSCVGVDHVEWDYGVGYVSLPTHIYNTCGVKTITQKSYDKMGLFCTKQKQVNIVYHVNPGLSWSITNPNIGQQITFTPDITGHTDQVTGVRYFFDGELVFHSDSYHQAFTKVFDISKTYQIRQEITYNKCLDIDIIDAIYTIKVENRVPTCILDIIIDEIHVKITNIAAEVNSEIDMYSWEVFKRVISMTTNEVTWVSIFTSVWSSSNTLNLNLEESGTYKAAGRAKDKNGAIGTCNIEFNIVRDDCPDVVEPPCSDEKLYEFEFIQETTYIIEYEPVSEVTFECLTETVYEFVTSLEDVEITFINDTELVYIFECDVENT